MSALHIICAAISAFAVSMLSGMGVGGGGLFVVYLTLVSGVGRLQAQGINLWFFTAASAASLYFHVRHREINLPLVVFLSFCTCAGCIPGALLAKAADPSLLRFAFAAFMTATGAYTLFRKQ